MGKTMHALPISTVHPLCWTLILNAVCGGELQKGLLSFKNNMLITTHHTESREHVGVWNRCLVPRSSPVLSSPEVQGSENGKSVLSSGALSRWNVDLVFMSGCASITLLFLPPESSMTAASEYSWGEVRRQQCSRPAGVSSARMHALEEM